MNCRVSRRTGFDRCRYFDIRQTFPPFHYIGSNILSRVTTLRPGELRQMDCRAFDTRFDI